MAATFNDDGRARLSLVYTWNPSKPVAAWLMNNPSIAGRSPGEGMALAPTFDPTARRVIHFSRKLGAGSAILVNWCPLVATDPIDLWAMLAEPRNYPPSLIASNYDAISEAAEQARWRILACGPAGMRRHPHMARTAIQVFRGTQNILALGTSSTGAPLHPLARGKHAIPNERTPVPFDFGDWSEWQA